MSGIYGNSREDRYFENLLDRYTIEDDACQCKKIHDEDDKGLFINDTLYTFSEVEEACPECGNEIKED